MTTTVNRSETLKPRPNDEVYLRVLRRMGPAGRLLKALQLGEEARALFRIGLRRRFPQLSEAELKRLYLERLAKCHNTDY